MEKKGTVTQISSMFPPQEAQQASKRVLDAIGERQHQLNQLKGFADENTGLINLVQKLPDETHHNIMVPFGKAAFFPGRLIHTNEFVVLLGEGYYSERTSKQTVEILKRRGRDLETQVESLKAVMQDLKAEASFFDTTADESAEGLVEIREDYADEDSVGTSPGYNKHDSTPLEVNNRKTADEDEDEEFIRIKMRMDELEKEEEEEEEAERADGFDDSSDEDEGIKNEPDNRSSQNPIDQEARSLRVEASDVPALSKDLNNLALNNSMTSKKTLEQSPQDMKKVEAPPKAGNTAFTGLIVEHARNIGMQLPQQQSGARGSKPVSRFKMMQQRK